MRQPASTDREVLLREIEETEAVLAEASGATGCKHIIDPTETLADRVRHLAMMAILAATSLAQLQAEKSAPDKPFSYRELMDRMGKTEN